MTLLNQEPVRAAIWYAINNYQFQDAIFLAERLHTEIGTSETRYLLATCYYRAGYKRQALHLLKTGGEVLDASSKLLCARCYLDLKEYKAGLVVLNGLVCLSDNNEEDIVIQFGADAGLAFWLLGELNRLSHVFDEAVKHYRNSLKYNPYLWSSFEALCHLGVDVSPEEYFMAEKCPKFQAQHMTVPDIQPQNIHLPDVVEKTVTEVTSNVTTTMETPELYANPALGCAQASSTPDPSRGQVPQKDHNLDNITDPSPSLWGSVNSLSTAPGNLLPPGLSSVRTVLHFGSGRSSVPSTGEKKVPRAILQSGGLLTPVNPSFGMLSMMTGTHLTTPSQTPNKPNLSDIDQSASSAVTSAPRKRHNIPSIARVTHSGGVRTKSRVVNVAAENFTPSSDTPLPYLTPKEEENTSTSDGDHAHVSDDDHRSAENMQPSYTPSNNSHTSMRPESAPRRSARLSTAKQQSRFQELSTPVIKGKSRAQSSRNLATDRLKKATKGGSSSQGVRRIVSSSRRSSPLTPGNKQNIQRSGATVSTPNMETEDDVLKKPPTTSEEVMIYSNSISSLMKLMASIATAYKALSRYELVQCLELFSGLPSHQMNTSWVFSQLARAHFEQGNYNEAVGLYQQVQLLDPYRFQGMEYYSASLWHLEKTTELSLLADDLRHADILRPETWCVMGNLMSLNKDHESAIKFIERAIQVCPQFVYSYQLLSHEYIITENYDKALQALRTAVSINPRSCDSWFVMGVIYYLQEKYRFAEHHIKKAIAINKNSSLMYSQLGMVYSATEAYNEALECLDRAVRLDPSKALPRFDRTRVLQKAGRLQEALSELEELARRVPKEAQIYLQMDLPAVRSTP
ncbi:cell division cycle protein 27 homolog isoform X2 [Dysidea avara]|uniref:cell division cycle protein 27 homolog isoform X2 n=1 Tax=Dysidea avara TaxID=196820 RepID=UPI00332ED31E